MSRPLTEQAEALLRDVDRQEHEKKSARLTPSDKVMILRLAMKGNTQEQIAAVVHCDQSTVSRVLRDTVDSRPEARILLEAGAAKLAQTVVDTDDPSVALKALGKLDVVRDDRENAGGNNILIAIGQPGAPLEPPVITIAADGSVVVGVDEPASA